VRLQRRRLHGLHHRAERHHPVWLRLVRSGASITGSHSANGTTWTTVGTVTLTGANSTEDAGMFSTAHAGTPGTASFSQFSIS